MVTYFAVVCRSMREITLLLSIFPTTSQYHHHDCMPGDEDGPGGL